MTQTPTLAGLSEERARTAGWARGPLPERAALALLGLLAILPPLVLSRYWLYLATSMCAYAVALIGLKVLFGDCGQLSLGQAAFVGIGAYSAAIITSDLRLTAPYELLVVVLVSGLVAVIIAVPALRVSGLRFALVTLAFGQLFQWFLREQKDLTGGEQGLYTPAMLTGPIDSGTPARLYFVVLFVALCFTLLGWHLPRTRTGRAMAAVRESEMAAISVGVSVWRTKLFAFSFAAIAAGISGMLLAHTQGSISPTTFDLFSSIYLIVGLILGGARSTAGAWIGSAYLVAVPALFTSAGLDRVYVLLSGAILLVVIMAFPSGVAGVAGQMRRRLRERAP